jgi:hypothetical protein
MTSVGSTSPGHLDVKAAPAPLAVMLAADDLLHGGVNPDLPAIILILRLPIRRVGTMTGTT